jgi:hypothetical protein
MTMYFAVIATRRSDLDEWIVSLVSNEALARVVGWRTLDEMPGVLRCRVKRVWLTRPEVFEVVKVWGRVDAEQAKPISAARKMPQPYRTAYLKAYTSAISRPKQ